MHLESKPRDHPDGQDLAVFCVQHPPKDYRRRPGFDVHADAIMDRGVIHAALWIGSGGGNLREGLGFARDWREPGGS